MTTILLGCDPEVFVTKAGIVASGFGLIQGTKECPFPVEKGAVQVDGMALEFNIDPAKTLDEFRGNVKTVLNQLRNIIPSGFTMEIMSTAHFSAEVLKAQPFEALELGCSPDYNGWTLEENETPPQDVTFRTAAGHIHIGWGTQNEFSEDSFEHRDKAGALAQQMDFYLGLPSLLVDTDTKRRELYGKAGAHRPKTYGMEYRVLSNFWIKEDALIDWVYRASMKAYLSLSKDFLPRKYGDIQEIINTSNVEKAMEIIEAENLEQCYA